MDSQKPWAIITGANGGIGAALCAEFSLDGRNVLALDILDKPKQGLVHTNYLSMDLNQYATDLDYAEKINSTIFSLIRPHKLEVLVNNAAVQLLDSSRTLARSCWEETMRVNVTAPFFLSQAMIPMLEVTKGAIINISSIHASQTKKNFVAYATSKAALSALSRNMALDLGDKIRVNAIEPAAISTDMLRAGFDKLDNKFEQLESFHPIGRIGKPSEVARLAVYLASPQAGFIHGACISVSGGIHNCLNDPV